FTSQDTGSPIFSYRDFIPVVTAHFTNEGIRLGENALGIKCFCRDDNQDQIGNLLTGIGRSSGWFDMNAFGAYPAGRSLESFEPPSHHIPQLQGSPWTVVFHATHVGCDSNYTLGMTERYNMRNPGASCGLLASILNRDSDRRKGKYVPFFKDYEMHETEISLMPYLDEIKKSAHPMAAAAEKVFDLGSGMFETILRENDIPSFYVGGINIDNDAVDAGNNYFILKTAYIFKERQKRKIEIREPGLY
ncbi:MAG: hypothetical protein P8Y80_14540, partial [Acidobacteriota bacterium]